MKFEYKGKSIVPTVECNHNIMPIIAGISDKDFFFNQEKCMNAWKVGNDYLAEYYKGRLPRRMPTAAPLSYGHLVSIGSKLNISEAGEPDAIPFASDIDEAIAIMKEVKGIDFGKHELCQYYMDTNRKLQAAFPEYKIPVLAGYGRQGIITTAVLMRGQDFFIDLYEEPEKVTEYLDLLIESIIDFDRWGCRMEGKPDISEIGAGIADDFAALVTPSLWPEFVIPYWNRFFEARTTGKGRFVHCEDMHVPHLKYLKDAKVTQYQPSVSDHLTIESIKKEIDIPFDWLLYSWKTAVMSDEEIQTWVDSTVEAGITTLRTQIDAYTWKIDAMDRIAAFYDAFEKYRVE